MSFNKYAAAAKSCGCYREAPRRDHGQGNLCGTYDQSYYQGSRCGSFTGGNGARCNFGENVVAAGAALGSAWLLNKFLNNGDAGLVNFYAKQEKLRESECALLVSFSPPLFVFASERAERNVAFPGRRLLAAKHDAPGTCLVLSCLPSSFPTHDFCFV